MKYSRIFARTSMSIAGDLESVNARLLTQAGYIHQEVAGVYTFLPLGLRVLNRIENIVREEMNKIGVEILMTTLSPTSTWETTGRLETVDVLMKAIGANVASKQKSTNEYVINSTHEEMITPLAKQYIQSYKELPTAIYQIQTKFRNEARAKSGLLRGREFRMKDLYSFHLNEADLLKYYDEVIHRYHAIFERLGLGLDTYRTYASGGDFTDQYSHEFQTVLEAGEDTIYLDRVNKIAYNKEVVTPNDAKKLGVNFDVLEQVKASEVGNIFPLNTKFSDAFDYTLQDADGTIQKIYMGCYGIGTSRLMGVIAEKFADENGLVWPEEVAPYKYHLITLGEGESEKVSQKIYEFLGSENCLWDDRKNISAGKKFTDADLLGCPLQVIVSPRNLKEEKIEIKNRAHNNKQFINLEELLQK